MDAAEVRKLTELEDRHWWYSERRHVLKQHLEPLTPGTALDIGAAGGGNTRVLRDYGWDAAALEYGEPGAVVAHERGIPTTRGSATDLPFADNSFDLVTALDVLEHLEDDDKAASEILRVLRPGARLLVTVPCGPELWSDHDVAVDHVRRYTKESIQDLLLRNGFTLDGTDSWMVLLRPVVQLRRALTRKKSEASTGQHASTSDSDLQDMHPVVNMGLKSVVMMERFLPVKKLPGVTVVVRARKPL